MSKSRKNAITYGMSGKFGEQFVLRNGVLCEMPKRSKRPKTEKQLAAQDKFLIAANYAKVSMENDEKKAVYAAAAAKGETAYNKAISDYFNAPRIMQVNALDYKGETGNRIDILAIDDVQVKAVRVYLYNSAGELVEEGAASREHDALEWHYIVTASNQSPSGGKLVIKAWDLPGNLAEAEYPL